MQPYGSTLHRLLTNLDSSLHLLYLFFFLVVRPCGMQAVIYGHWSKRKIINVMESVIDCDYSIVKDSNADLIVRN